MAVSDQNQNELTITNRTIIGSIMGQVHTDSINVFYASRSGTVSTKDEFLGALRAFRVELEIARQQGLSEETVDDTDVEIEAAEREAKKNEPKAKRIVGRLANAKTMLLMGTGVTTGSATARLISLIENIAQSVSKVFKVS